VQQTLVGKVLAHPNIAVLEHQVAVDLITGAGIGADDNRCHGIHCFDSRNRRIETYTAGHVVLATGGAGQVYLHTSNPDIATGDGIAMGWRAGCAVQNMEFVQFHPTCLHHRDARSFLVSEALRGEGGILRLPGGERFMHRHDERGELAPRDVVARAIDFEMKQHGLDCVHLDITHRPEGFLHEHFPSIHARCLQLGIDMARQPIPVVPAAHYLCGGLRTDIAGRTGLANLYAVGETACTGLHGANRLASNSLLECLALGRAAARDILESDPTPRRGVPQPDRSRCAGAADQAAIVRSRDQLQRLMWDCVGIVRTSRLLDGAAQRIALMRQELKDCCAGFPLETALIELRNLVQTAELIVRCAQARPESRGLHCNLDYPGLAPLARDTVLHSVLS
jgi:L-aspartate oxidase